MSSNAACLEGGLWRAPSLYIDVVPKDWMVATRRAMFADKNVRLRRSRQVRSCNNTFLFLPRHCAFFGLYKILRDVHSIVEVSCQLNIRVLSRIADIIRSTTYRAVGTALVCMLVSGDTSDLGRSLIVT